MKVEFFLFSLMYTDLVYIEYLLFDKRWSHVKKDLTVCFIIYMHPSLFEATYIKEHF